MTKDDLPPEYYQGLVSPADAENPYSMGQLRKRMWWFAGQDDKKLFGDDEDDVRGE